MASFKDLPAELLSLIAGDPDLTNHDRKQARLACRNLAAVMTPYIFRRAYISWIKADRDAFLSLATAPHLAAHVEEVVWFEMEYDWKDLDNLSNDLEGLTDLRADLLTTGQGLCWPPIVRPRERSEFHGDFDISNPRCRDHREYASEFSLEFKAAVALMPKIHTFSSEPMPWGRIISAHPDSYPFHIGLMKTHAAPERGLSGSRYLDVFLETIHEEKGRITRLRCADKLGSVTLAAFRLHEAYSFLTSLELSVSSTEASSGTTFRRDIFKPIFQKPLFKASLLQEFSLFLDRGAEDMRIRRPKAIWDLFLEESGEVHRWEHLRSLKLGYVNVKKGSTSFLSVIAAHVGTLRHLHLEQCRPAQSFARELFQLSGLQLTSITISDSEIPKSGLISERELLRFIHQGDTEDPTQAREIAEGKFVTDNRRPDDDVDDEPFEEEETDSDHFSEWWSDSDSDFGL